MEHMMEMADIVGALAPPSHAQQQQVAVLSSMNGMILTMEWHQRQQQSRPS